jgi:hypothetical protein
MKNHTFKSPLYWLSNLSTAVLHYKCDPSKTNRAHLVAAIFQFKELVDDGLVIPKVIPEPTPREPITYSQWMLRQVDEAVLMFRCSPTYERIIAVLNMLNFFEDSVAKGRVTI